MPFFTADTASISLSLLKGALHRAGHECDIEYFNLDFAERLGLGLYNWIAGDAPPYLLFGDLVFAPTLHDTVISEDRLRELMAPLGTPGLHDVPENVVAAFPRLVEIAHKFMEERFETTDWSAYDLIGFSTMFQIAPPLAMARRIKRLTHPPKVIIGGSYCEGPMGEQLVRSFPWIDFACTGEGEDLIVELARAMDGDEGLHTVPGLVWRDGVNVRRNPDGPPAVTSGVGGSSENGIKNRDRTVREAELDHLPIPTYDDWLTQVRASGLMADEKLRLPIETSRGCWYGAKHHCVFCGLNGSTITYRRKSGARALEEFRMLKEYGVRMVHSVDNIFDFRYFKSLLPDLIALDHGFEIFYEMKSNLSWDHVKLLHDSGIVWIQPGIESLSTPILDLMGKGVTGLQNIRLLRYAAEFCIGTAWNLLYGFPGENPDDFARMAAVLPALSHLQPPYISCCRVRIHRFSPLYMNRDSNGLRSVKPTASYEEIYPFEPEEVARLAYYFEHEYVDEREPNSYIESCASGVLAWHDEVGDAAFFSFHRGERIILIDTRRIATARRTVLDGVECEVYEATLHGATADEIVGAVNHPDARSILDTLVDRNIVLRMDDRHLALAVPMDRYAPLHVPLTFVEEAVLNVYRERMSRIRQGFVDSVPLTDRLGSERAAPMIAVPDLTG